MLPRSFPKKDYSRHPGKNSPETWYLPIKEFEEQNVIGTPRILRPDSGSEPPGQ